MVIAHHIMLTGYGHWFPNDPRGSCSHELRSPEIQKLGAIHFGRKRTQPTREQLRAFYREAEKHLRFPVQWFGRADRDAIGSAFRNVINSERLTCYACAILQNHVHILIRKHRLKAEDILHRLKVASRDCLRTQGLFPATHGVWSERADVRYKDTTDAVRSCVEYIHDNFRKHRIDVQEWDFITPYDNWPLHKRQS